MLRVLNVLRAEINGLVPVKSTTWGSQPDQTSSFGSLRGCLKSSIDRWDMVCVVLRVELSFFGASFGGNLSLPRCVG